MKPAVAFIGLGIMGRRMLTNMQAHGGFSFAGGWDPSAEAAATACGSFPELPIAPSAAALMEDDRTDLVYIACPPAHHADHALAAIAAGKAVLCEKPLAVDPAQGRLMVERAEAAGVAAAVNFPFADARAANAIAAALDEGAVGAVAGIDVRVHFARWPRDWQADARWLAQRAQGGFVREVLSHFIYLTHRLLGPARLDARSVRYPADPRLCETHVLAQLTCGDVPVSIAGGTGGTGPDLIAFTVWGERRSYRLYDWNRLRSSTGEVWREELADLADPRQDGYRRMLDNLRAMLDGRAHTMPSFGEAYAVQEIVEAILREGPAP